MRTHKLRYSHVHSYLEDGLRVWHLERLHPYDGDPIRTDEEVGHAFAEAIKIQGTTSWCAPFFDDFIVVQERPRKQLRVPKTKSFG